MRNDITVTLTQQEADYITQALGYHFQKSRLTRETALKYGVVVGKLVTAKPAENHAPEASEKATQPSREDETPPTSAAQLRRLTEPMEKWDTQLELGEIQEGADASLAGFKKGDYVVVLENGEAGQVGAVYTNALWVEKGSGGGQVVLPAEIELASFMAEK